VTMKTIVRPQDYRFFRDHAGYVVGRSAEYALQLARAEQYAQDHGWDFDWIPDPEPDLSWCDTCIDRPHAHEIEGCILNSPEDSHLASLWGITDADQNYRRVIEAELALEAMPEVTPAWVGEAV
jgi:hypothetical protein